MTLTTVCQSAAEIPDHFQLIDLPKRRRETSVLMITPDFYDVEYVINPHMADTNGQLHRIDRGRALEQWQELRRTYESLGLKVEILKGGEGLPDMVFAANQSFPFVDSRGQLMCLPSQMKNIERQNEVAPVAQFYQRLGFKIATLSNSAATDTWEGAGDALWIPGCHGLLIGHGFRTTQNAAFKIAQLVNAPTFLCELTQPGFYHLDTAIAPISATTALWFPEAFTARGRALIRRLFVNLIEASAEEAKSGLACNAHFVDPETVVLDRCCQLTSQQLTRRGVRVYTVDVSEFRKSGGSVFCLKMMLPTA